MNHIHSIKSDAVADRASKANYFSRHRMLALGGALAILMAGCAERRTASATDTDPQAMPPPSAVTSTAGASTPQQEQLEPTGRVAEQGAAVVLNEEKLDIEKRTVPAGGVLIKKDVETREVSQPVELRTETVDVQRLTPEEARQRGVTAAGAGEINAKGEVYIPLEREEAVVRKEVQPREVVRATTSTGVEQKDVDATLRREVVEIERQAAGTMNTQSASQPLERRIRTELRNASGLGLGEQQLDQLGIRVEAGTVTLSGSVPNQDVSQKIEQMVGKVDGVQTVENQLQTRQ